MPQTNTPRRAATRTTFIAATLLAGFLLTGCAASSSAPAHRGQAGNDLADLQGSWEQLPDGGATTPGNRVVKKVTDRSETVTAFNENGGVVSSQTAKIQLGRGGDVPTYTFYDRAITAGPEAGRRFPERSTFVYRLRGDELLEVWGLLPGQEKRELTVVRWKRVKE